MTMLQLPENVADETNQSSLADLAWAIEGSVGEFSLFLARCNSTSLRKRLTESLQASCSLEIREIFLDKSCQKLYQTIQDSLCEEHPQALMVSGLESVSAIKQMLTAANQVREEFRKNFHFPLVLWVTDEVLQKLIRLAPDLHSWTTSVQFAIATDDLINFIQQTADEVFAKVLDAGAGRFLDSTALNLGIGSPRRIELESARQEFQKRGVSLNPELEASLEFLLGRAFHGSMEQSLQHYEQSLKLFGYSFGVGEAEEIGRWEQIPNYQIQNPESLKRLGCLLYSLGLWWRTYGVIHRYEYNQACEHAKKYFNKSIQVFEQTSQPELVAKFINGLGGVLQRLEHWQELEVVANKALALHQTYPDQFKLARAYGLLAEVALAKSAWDEAKQAAKQALLVFEKAEASVSTSVSPEMRADLDWERSYHRGWYSFALGRSLLSVGNVEEAIVTLETARTETKPQYDPLLYVGILSDLRDGYFQQSKYLTAFRIKKEQRSIEQQYGFRAFIGAGRLQPKQQVTNPSLPIVEKQESVAQEISASGRQQDINRLVERMGRSDHKLTIIHGQSGVGLSSILQAGLIPALKQKPIGTRDVLPVLQRVYTDWSTELGKALKDALTCPLPVDCEEVVTRFEPSDSTILDSTTAIIEQLKKHDDDYKLLTVLIFDQLEEFFSLYKDPKQRRSFYDFIHDCLEIPYVKVILALRDDYLHYLLECNRIPSFEVINNNILDKDNLYHLGNFSLDDAKTFIQKLTQNTQLALEEELIDELVHDLARDLGEVRPIELQVVGSQLQNYKIKTLVEYQKYGPKEKLVWHFLEEIIKDCGSENEPIAKLVLYLLTDENNNSYLKTYADLESELDVRYEKEKLDLVLEILVKSGLVFKVPVSQTKAYQLVHNYLVAFIRQEKGSELLVELKHARDQQRLSEKLVEQYLAQVISNCGDNNEQIAQQILYLLSEENNTSTVKTRADFKLAINVKSEELNLVLDKLVESGIVIRKSAFPTDKYQLLHDYMGYFRSQEQQKQSARLIAELEKEREQRKLTQASLSEVIKKLQLRKELNWKVTLGVIATILGILEAILYLW